MNATACEMYLNVLLTINILICIKSIINLIRNDTQEVAVVAVRTYQLVKKNQSTENFKKLTFVVYFTTCC